MIELLKFGLFLEVGFLPSEILRWSSDMKSYKVEVSYAAKIPMSVVS